MLNIVNLVLLEIIFFFHSDEECSHKKQNQT